MHALKTEGPDLARRREVWAALASVVDPELDEPVTDMGFISRADVDDEGRVHVGFRLPTYWCAANFAFMMADDMRSALLALPWVQGTSIVLGEHMYADKINKGVAEGWSFEETFGEEANGNLDGVRRTFLIKSYQRRQEALMRHLLDMDVPAADVVAMTVLDLRTLGLGPEGCELRRRYLERRGLTGLASDDAPAFVSSAGDMLSEMELPRYLGELRRIRANAEFNGALCRGLLSVRFDMETPLARKCSSPAPDAHQSNP